VSFLILHEITAIVPLFGIAAGLHYAPDAIGVDKLANIPFIEEGRQRMWRWGVRRGWVKADEQDHEVQTLKDEGRNAARKKDNAAVWVMELAAAWAITKFLLPVRIGASVWATPWFARTIFGPLRRMFKGKSTVV
jgi:hypothetical protein